jgi:hypothetical protein
MAAAQASPDIPHTTFGHALSCRDQVRQQAGVYSGLGYEECERSFRSGRRLTLTAPARQRLVPIAERDRSSVTTRARSRRSGAGSCRSTWLTAPRRSASSARSHPRGDMLNGCSVVPVSGRSHQGYAGDPELQVLSGPRKEAAGLLSWPGSASRGPAPCSGSSDMTGTSLACLWWLVSGGPPRPAPPVWALILVTIPRAGPAARARPG